MDTNRYIFEYEVVGPHKDRGAYFEFGIHHVDEFDPGQHCETDRFIVEGNSKLIEFYFW